MNWVLWTFRWGRYSGPASTDSKIRYVLTDFLVNIINDFRHLLALVIVILFGVALFTAMWPGMMKEDVTLIKDGLQGVLASFGGLLGAVIGYYFGESAASKRFGADQPSQAPKPAEQGTVGGDVDKIETPPKPALP